jgi:hypothetical protein
MSAGNGRFSFFFTKVLLNPITFMRQQIFQLTTATLAFCVVMSIVLAFFVPIDADYGHGPLYIIDVMIKFLLIPSLISFGVFTYMAIDRYLDMPAQRVTLPHCKAEIEWTEIERDEEGEEISRQKYEVTVYHTMTTEQLGSVVEFWHEQRRRSEGMSRTSEGFVDFINAHTPHWGALTQEDLLNRLKNK